MSLLRRLQGLTLGLALLAASAGAVAAPAAPIPTLPTQARYVQVMQHPEHYLRDATLAGRVSVATVTVAGHEQPLHWSGNFGSVFKATTPSQSVALRVFHLSAKPEQVRDIAHRYTALEAYFGTLATGKRMPPELLPVTYVAKGLHIDGHDVPLVKSPWVEGDELHEAVAKSVNSPKALEALASNWRGLARDLRASGIAHGDLQHRNVKVEAGTGNLRLIDYDAMFVPELRGHFNSEVGHPNFEHPAYHFDAQGNPRPSFRPFDERMDHFSSFVIYTSLVVLAKHPALWATYHNDQTLIFDGHRDFLHPETSPLFAALLRSPHEEVRTLATKLMAFAKGAPKDVPPLDEALGGAPPKPEAAFAMRTSLHDGALARVTGRTLGSQAVSEPMRDPRGKRAEVVAEAPRAAARQATHDPAGGALGPSVVPAIVGPLHAVSSKNPGTLLILQDTSGSMVEEFIPGITKAHAAANAINGTLADFVRASNQGGTIKDRWNVSVLNYGNDRVTKGLRGSLLGSTIHPISVVADQPLEIVELPDAEGQMVPSPLWVHPVADGGTPMRKAFVEASDVLTGYEKNLVLAVHVTDGVSTDGDPTHAVQSLVRKVTTAGGQLLLTNIHVSTNADPAKAMVFPTPEEAAHLDEHGQLLFALSSPVPASLAAQLGTRPGARMFAYNAAPDQLAAVFRAGSSVAGAAR